MIRKIPEEQEVELDAAEVLTRKHDQIGANEKFCTNCGVKKDHEEFDIHANSADGRRNTCKDCRRTIRDDKRQQKMIAELSEQESRNIETFKRLANKGGSMNPHVSEMFESMMEPFGGQRGFAKHMWGNYIAAAPGSQMRFKIIQSIMKLGESVSKQNLSERRIDMLEDADVVREMKRYLESYQDSSGVNATTVPTASGDVIDISATPIEQIGEALMDGPVGIELPEEFSGKPKEEPRPEGEAVE